jgi:cyclase
MQAMADRRRFLKTVVGGAAGVSLSYLAPGAALARSRPDPLTATALTDRLTLISGAGSNVVALTGPEGVLLVDGGVAERSADLMKVVNKLSDKRRVHTLFNTHWHWDHTGSNERLSKSGANIIAHEYTKLWLGADFYVDWQDRQYKPRPAAALPTQTFYKTGEMMFGDEKVEYGHLFQAHTDGDIYVFFRNQNVLVAGDVVSVGSYPILDYSTGGWLGGIVDATKRLVELTNDTTRIIPGTGPVQSRADLRAEAEMLATMKDRLIGLMKKGIGTDDLLANPPTREFDGRWGDPKLFLTNAFRGLWGHVRELGGIV